MRKMTFEETYPVITTEFKAGVLTFFRTYATYLDYLGEVEKELLRASKANDTVNDYIKLLMVVTQGVLDGEPPLNTVYLKNSKLADNLIDKGIEVLMQNNFYTTAVENKKEFLAVVQTLIYNYKLNVAKTPSYVN